MDFSGQGHFGQVRNLWKPFPKLLALGHDSVDFRALWRRDCLAMQLLHEPDEQIWTEIPAGRHTLLDLVEKVEGSTSLMAHSVCHRMKLLKLRARRPRPGRPSRLPAIIARLRGGSLLFLKLSLLASPAEKTPIPSKPLARSLRDEVRLLIITLIVSNHLQ